MQAAKLLAASGSSVAKTYSDDVFSATTYVGNGSTQTITNGIDLAGKGGMVWIKSRNNVYGHFLFDSARGLTKKLSTNTTAADTTYTAGKDVASFDATGFSLGIPAGQSVNENGDQCVGFTFRKAAKFFDVVTYTGNGANRTIAHSLGSVPGMIIVKCVSNALPNGTAANWTVYHNGLTAAPELRFLVLNSTAAETVGSNRWNSTAPTSTAFSIGTAETVNFTGETYVAYLFAHDTTSDGLIKCGSFTTDGSGNATVSLGWEPQYVLVKETTSAHGADSGWWIADASRGLAAPGGGLTPYLFANTSGAEGASVSIRPAATGFTIGLYASTPYVYLAIRRPNKPPTLGTQVYNAIARTGTGAAATVTGVGFAPDLDIVCMRSASPMYQGYVFDRLRGTPSGGNLLSMSATNAEQAYGNTITNLNMDGVTFGSDPSGVGVNSGGTSINYFFKRAPGVFDVVCFSLTGSATVQNHSLGAAPELVILKRRDDATYVWAVYKPGDSASHLKLNLTDAASSIWGALPATSATFTPAWGTTSNYVAYLFATLAGVSKVGSYTGNGSSQTIACGFTTGARFVLIKRTDSTGDWFCFDTARGIVAGNDPHLSMNTTAVEVTTDDSIDPGTSGFIVNQLAATNINVTSATYIFLAFS